jgi:alpha-beta hydrolase superfamily lysophospholipase
MSCQPGSRCTDPRPLALLLWCALWCGWGTAARAAQPEPERLLLNAAGQQVTVWGRQSEHPQGIVVLVHGRTWSTRPVFDFEPRSGSRSLLKALAAAGFAAYAIDLPGYGSSQRVSSGWLAPTRAADVVEAVLPVVAHRHPDLPPPVLLGWSRGSKISALVASRARQPLSGLVLYGYNLDPTAPPDNGAASGKAPAVANTAEWARSDFVTPAVASPAMIEDFVSAALAADPIRVDVCCDVEFLAIHPEAIRIPTLLLHGARDPAFKPAVAAAFFSHLATAERRWIIIASGDHAAHLEDCGPEVAAAMIDFIRAALRQPARCVGRRPPDPSGSRERPREIGPVLGREWPVLVAAAAIPLDVGTVLEQQDQLAARVSGLQANLAALRTFGREWAQVTQSAPPMNQFPRLAADSVTR